MPERFHRQCIEVAEADAEKEKADNQIDHQDPQRRQAARGNHHHHEDKRHGTGAAQRQAAQAPRAQPHDEAGIDTEAQPMAAAGMAKASGNNRQTIDLLVRLLRSDE